jgi:hypothetical protein
MEDVDHKSGVQDGYSAKLFVGIRGFGVMSLQAVLGALDADLVVIPRPGSRAVETRQLSADTADRVGRHARPPMNEGSSP